MVAQRVSPQQRFTRWNPCPICLGWDAMARRKGRRCAGFSSDDGVWAHCERADLAGEIRLSPSSPPTYAHRLDGPCRCGVAHGQPAVSPPPRPRPSGPPKAPTRTHRRHTPIAAHEYQEADGSVRFRVVRFWSGEPPPDREDLPKCIPQRPDGAGDWLDGLEGMGYGVPYRLPELLAATGRTVFIPEGEACVDELMARGLVATTNAGGALKWQPEYSECLRGRHVVILADNDAPGEQHAQQVAAALQGIAASVRVLMLPNLPEGGDVRDWLAAGGAKDDLYDLVIATSEVGAQIKFDFEHGSETPEPEVSQRVREANARMNERLRTVVKTAAVKTQQVSATARMNLLVIRNHLERNADRVDEHGLLQVFLPKLAEGCGVSVGTLGTNLRTLESVGALRREEHYVTNTEGIHVKRISIGPGPNIDKPEAWVVPDAPKRGGRREGAGRPRKCPECGGPHVKLIKRTMLIIECQNVGCGAKTQERLVPDEVVPNDPEPEDAGDPQIKVCSVSVPAEGCSSPPPDRPCYVCGEHCWIRGPAGAWVNGCQRQEAG